MRNIIIYDILIPSLRRMYEMDYENIRFGVSERNICARLALHMENIMREYDRNHNSDTFHHYFADVEYNRMGNGELKRFENSEHLPQYMVADLLIQSRGEPHNFLAVEMKRKSNYVKRNKDRERLEALVSSIPVRTTLPCVYGTTVGAFIIYSQKEVYVEFYENADTHGTKTGEMKLECKIENNCCAALDITNEIWRNQ